MRANPVEWSSLLAATRAVRAEGIDSASKGENTAIHGAMSMNLENLSLAMAHRALQDLYRDLIETAIATSPEAYRPAMREMQGRIDAAHSPDSPDDSGAIAAEALSNVFKSFMPTDQCSPKDPLL